MRKSFDIARNHALRALLVLLAVTLVSGCGIFSPDEGGDGDNNNIAEPWKAATTPTQLAENFRRVWEERNIDQYDLLLAENFAFYLWSEDINDEFPTGFWDRAQEIRTAEFMFGTPPDPSLTVVSIEFTRFEPVQTWSPDITNTELSDADYVATYRVQLRVNFTDVSETVQGQQRLYIKQVERDGQQVYVLRAWEDLGVALF